MSNIDINQLTSTGGLFTQSSEAMKDSNKSQETSESIFDTEPVSSAEERDFTINYENTLGGKFDDDTTGLFGLDWFGSTRKTLEKAGIDMDGYEKSTWKDENGDKSHFFVKSENGVTEYLRTVKDEAGNRYVIHSVDDTNTGERTTNMYLIS